MTNALHAEIARATDEARALTRKRGKMGGNPSAEDAERVRLLSAYIYACKRALERQAQS
jgi:hypothetical protein